MKVVKVPAIGAGEPGTDWAPSARLAAADEARNAWLSEQIKSRCSSGRHLKGQCNCHKRGRGRHD